MEIERVRFWDAMCDFSGILFFYVDFEREILCVCMTNGALQIANGRLVCLYDK